MQQPSYLLILLAILSVTNSTFTQTDTCIHPVQKYLIQSAHLGEARAFWVSLPLRYDTANSYPVLYVLDAEWRMEMISRIVYDLGGNEKIPHHIVVGIPHIDWRKQRGVDLTFSHSRNEYDESPVDATTYNAENSGAGERFFAYLDKELMPAIAESYATNGQNILVGHSYGGYFGSYILGRTHQFTALQIYDPSIWYSNGEAIDQIKKQLSTNKKLNVFIAYQPVPTFHAKKIKALIKTLSRYRNIELGFKKYKDETHNSLFLPSFLAGIEFLYQDWEKGQ